MDRLNEHLNLNQFALIFINNCLFTVIFGQALHLVQRLSWKVSLQCELQSGGYVYKRGEHWKRFHYKRALGRIVLDSF